jgi:hypothetical protein
MRSVVMTRPALIRDTLALLLLVAAMPFPASLLGRYGSEPIAWGCLRRRQRPRDPDTAGTAPPPTRASDLAQATPEEH